MKRNRKAFFLFLMLAAPLLFFSTCMERGTEASDARGRGFAGMASCRSCHRAVYDSYLASMHAHTTQDASPSTVKGPFGANTPPFAYNDSVSVRLESRDSGLFQAAYVHNREAEAHRMDIAFGGKHAQTFLYWQGEKTFELPLSWYATVGGWATSPGFSADRVNFSRFIGANCYECHSSYIGSLLNASTAGIEQVLDRNTLIYGIDCERCHGPAAQHVDYHRANRDEKEAKYMVRIGGLSRQQQLDVCAVCHSGNDKMEEKSTFKFRPGDTLAHFFTLWPSQDRDTGFDVHGNQYQLLKASPCFRNSRTLTCGTCHNPHTDSNGDLKAYSAVCSGCHANPDHTTVSATQLQGHCVDCHMPLQPSKAITYQTAGSKTKSAYMLRTHEIRVW